MCIRDRTNTAIAQPETTSTNFIQPPAVQPEPEQSNTQWDGSDTAAASSDEIISLIEKLANLRDIGALTDEDFDAKKKELLARI